MGCAVLRGTTLSSITVSDMDVLLPLLTTNHVPLLLLTETSQPTGIDGVPFTLNPKLNMDVIANDVSAHCFNFQDSIFQ